MPNIISTILRRLVDGLRQKLSTKDPNGYVYFKLFSSGYGLPCCAAIFARVLMLFSSPWSLQCIMRPEQTELLYSRHRNFTIRPLKQRSTQGFTQLCARECTMDLYLSKTVLRCTAACFTCLLLRHLRNRYNKVQLVPRQSHGIYSCENPQTLQHDLKDTMGFDGFVVSDCTQAEYASGAGAPATHHTPTL